MTAIAARIEAATPKDRDRYLDLLRVLAIALVILGHWGVRVVTEADGELVTGYLLALRPEWQWATLVWQVMPVFFFVGGRVNAESWRRARVAGEAPVAWVRLRARRLLWPALPLLAVLIPAAALTHAMIAPQTMIFDFGVAVFPLWFLAAYLAVTALTPLTLDLHERDGGIRMLALCVALAVAVDVLRFTLGGPMLGTQPAVGTLNFLLVWVVIHQLGYLWADGHLPERAPGQLMLVLAGAGCLVVMIGSGLYPLTMVPIEGTTRPNNGSPPSAALVALALVQLGCALLLRRPVTRWLERPGFWAPVALVGPRLITLFLWHQAVMIAVANLAYSLGWFPVTERVDATWWALRPLWFLVCLAVLVVVVLVVHRFDTPPQRLARPNGKAGVLPTALGVLLFGAGVAGLIATRLVQEAMPLQLPLLPLLSLLAGMLALGVFGPLGAARRIPDP